MPRWVWIVIGLFVLFFIVKQPDNAAHVGKSIGNGIVAVANGIGTFLSRVTA